VRGLPARGYAQASCGWFDVETEPLREKGFGMGSDTYYAEPFFGVGAVGAGEEAV
jgi:hypothetical protein